MPKNPVKISDTLLRDAHQSLLATRMRTQDMLELAAQMDKIGYWSVEMWGGATFDSAMRFLGEDPWERIRVLRKVMPNTRFQMLLRGQNVVGYKHYPDDILERFIVAAKRNGIDVFRIFDALNDIRNMEHAMKIVKREGGHVQAAISYTISPVHDIPAFVQMGRELADRGADSICIKDMAGMIAPYAAYELVAALKKDVGLPVQLHTHYTSGMATAALLKAVEAGVDVVDTAISSLSLSTSQAPTETIVACLKGTERDTMLDLGALADISRAVAEVRKKYVQLRGRHQRGGRERAAVPGAGRHALQPREPAAPARRDGPLLRRTGGSARACAPSWAIRRSSPRPASSWARRPHSTSSWESATR